jgi:hypothetical protein
MKREHLRPLILQLQPFFARTGANAWVTRTIP